jgi:hypothetical protein
MNLESGAAAHAIRALDISQVNQSATARAVSCYNESFLGCGQFFVSPMTGGASDDDGEFEL